MKKKNIALQKFERRSNANLTLTEKEHLLTNTAKALMALNRDDNDADSRIWNIINKANAYIFNNQSMQNRLESYGLIVDRAVMGQHSIITPRIASDPKIRDTYLVMQKCLRDCLVRDFKNSSVATRNKFMNDLHEKYLFHKEYSTAMLDRMSQGNLSAVHPDYIKVKQIQNKARIVELEDLQGDLNLIIQKVPAPKEDRYETLNDRKLQEVRGEKGEQFHKPYFYRVNKKKTSPAKTFSKNHLNINLRRQMLDLQEQLTEIRESEAGYEIR